MAMKMSLTTNKKPKYIFLTDTHATDNNLDLQVSVWKQAIDLCIKLDVKTILHGGDFVTARKAQSLEVLEHLVWVKNSIINSGLNLIGIAGNHDKTDQESIFSYPKLLNDESFRIIDNYENIKLDNFTISFLPYFPETGSYKDKYKKMSNEAILNKSEKNILLTHIGVNGGLAHENATSNKEVPADMFVEYDLVLIGHYHNRNKIECDIDTDIWYVGSAAPKDFGEDNRKGFTIIYDDCSIEFVDAKFPKFRTVNIEQSEINDSFIEELKKDISENKTNIRVIIDGDESELKALKKEIFSEIGVKKVKLNSNDVSLINKLDKVEFVNLDKSTLRSEYKKFCVSCEIDPKLGLEYI